MNGKSFGRLIMILLLAVNLVVTLTLVAVFVPRAAASTGCFPDTDGHWAEEFICWMSDQGLVGGYPDGTFKPNNQVTRAELSVITSKTYDLAEANDDDTLGALSCTTDQIAKWNGSAWECRADLSGAGGDYYTKGEVDAMMAALESQVSALETKLASVTTENGGQDVVFTGVNVHVRDGSGDTEGTVNGLGNLIVGYNEDTVAGGNATRTGSHNLVLGTENEYTSYGGFVGGTLNTISGAYSSVSGGYGNTASGDYSSVSGGNSNEASGGRSSVSGGNANEASGGRSSVSGGRENNASGYAASVNGGRDNEASGGYASVCGGIYNTASGGSATVLGGGGDAASEGNEAFAYYSVVVGGRSNLAGDLAGANRWDGEASAVLAGFGNEALEDFTSISGGAINTVSGIYSSVSGGAGNTASGNSSSVSGGYNNETTADYSTIGGGRDDTLSDTYDWQAGDLIESE